MAHILMDGIDAVTNKINVKWGGECCKYCAGGQDACSFSIKGKAKCGTAETLILPRFSGMPTDFWVHRKADINIPRAFLWKEALYLSENGQPVFIRWYGSRLQKSVIRAVFRPFCLNRISMFHPNIKGCWTVGCYRPPCHYPHNGDNKGRFQYCRKRKWKSYPQAIRLLCATGEKHIYNTTKSGASGCGDIIFKVSEKEVVRNGWGTWGCVAVL